MKNDNQKLKTGLKLLILVFTFSFLFFNLALAQNKPYELTVPIPTPSGEQKTVADPNQYVKFIYQFALGAGGLLAVAVITFGAIEYTVSAGNVSKQQEAKDRILNAVYGLALLLAAVLILYTINPRLITGSLIQLEEIKPPPPPQPGRTAAGPGEWHDQTRRTASSARALDDALLNTAVANKSNNPASIALAQLQEAIARYNYVVEQSKQSLANLKSARAQGQEERIIQSLQNNYNEYVRSGGLIDQAIAKLKETRQAHNEATRTPTQ